MIQINTQGRNLQPGDEVSLIDGWYTVKSVDYGEGSRIKLRLVEHRKVRIISGESWFYARRDKSRLPM